MASFLFFIGCEFGCNAQVRSDRAQVEDALPLSDYDVWHRWEQIEFSVVPGHFLALDEARSDGVSFWWVFFVEEGEYNQPTFRLWTTEGVYDSIRSMFTTVTQTKVFDDWPVTASLDNCESALFMGSRRVVAYARFPVEPKGDALSWEVIQ